MIETIKNQTILVTGGTGYVGQVLSRFLQDQGCCVRQLSRSPRFENQYVWQPDKRIMDKASLEGVDAVVHLAGETLFDKRWSKKRKAYILQNRQKSAETLVQQILAQGHLPKCVVVASAIGFYGDQGKDVLDENSPTGDGFPSEVCRDIESPFEQLAEKGIRVVIARFGIVLGGDGGALKKMHLPFSLGLGGSIGDGKQWMSWIQLEDCIRAMIFLMAKGELSGVFNITSPEPVTNQVFSQSFAKVLNRPCVMPLPAFVVRWVFGEMGESLLLSSARVMPKRLLSEGFMFNTPSIDKAMVRSLNKS